MNNILTLIPLILFSQFLLANVPFKKHDDIVFASPGGHKLTLDIYVPQTNKSSYPVIVIWHGGGFLVNDETNMDDMSAYIASEGEYIVCNMNYRLLPDQGNTVKMNQIVEDAFGGLLWVKEHISKYGGDSNRIGITGDSAGGGLVSLILNQGRNLSSKGFSQNNLSFNPTYLPPGKTAEDIVAEDGLAVQAAVISYSGYNFEEDIEGFETERNIFWQFAGAKPRRAFGNEFNVNDNLEMYKAISAEHWLPDKKEYRLPPQLHNIGTKDIAIPTSVTKIYLEKLRKADQEAEYLEFEGFNHGYLSSGCVEQLNVCFDTHGVPALKAILPFFDKHLK